MEKLPKKHKKPFNEKLNDQIDKIVYQVMTNQGLEQTVVIAVQKALIYLVIRYWFLIVVAVLALLLVQSLFLSLTFRWLVMPNCVV